MSERPYRFGYIPDLPDQRDYPFLRLTRPPTSPLPQAADLRPQCPPVYDQGNLGSCTANAIAAAIRFLRKWEKGKCVDDFNPSRLFIYYLERVLENTVNSDSGAQIRDGFKAIGSTGVCSEGDWPYDESGIRFNRAPTPKCYMDSKKDIALQYQRVNQDLLDMKFCLAAGFPIVIGFTVYQSFESDAVANSGNVPMPAAGESVLGGHAVLLVGYDDHSGVFILQNSWGTDWGQKGFFTLPQAYLVNSNLASDFWTLRKMGA